MIINLYLESDISNYMNEYKVKSNKLLTELNRINIGMEKRYNYLIIPISIYNIIECSDYFTSNKDSVINDDNLRLVGSIGEFQCYLDMCLPSNEIIVSWDKATSRNIKIESLLSDKKLEKEKKIKVMP
jgi:hypothetical protein